MPNTVFELYNTNVIFRGMCFRNSSKKLFCLLITNLHPRKNLALKGSFEFVQVNNNLLAFLTVYITFYSQDLWFKFFYICLFLEVISLLNFLYNY